MMGCHGAKLWVVCYAASLLLGVGLVQAAGPADAAPEVSGVKTQEREATIPNPDAGKVYVLQAGDEITVKVFGIPELEETVLIRPDGRISVQLLDEVVASGMTPGELDTLITERYTEFYKNPEVSVIVRNLANEKFFVGGQVMAPGLFPLQGRVTLVQAIFQAGGLRNTGKAREVLLLRDTGMSTPLAMRVNLKDVLKKGQPDILLKPFDVVFVPSKKIASVDRFVDQYIRQVLPFTMTAGFTYLEGNTATIVTP